MRTLLALLFVVVFCPSVMSANIYIRDDGGNSTECDGTVDAPKNDSKKCAFNYFSKEMVFSATTTDNIMLRKGKFVVTVKPPNLWITMEQFVARPEYYIRQVKGGRIVYFSKIDGIAYELILRKY